MRILAISTTICIAEILGGWYSGSLALLADAVHVAADVAAIVVSIVVAELVRANYNGHRARTYGFWINTALLALLVVFITTEAFERLYNPEPIISSVMLVVAVLGGIGNWFQHTLLHGHMHSQTSRVLSLHILSDLIMSIGVVVGALVVMYTNFSIVDPILSLVIAGWILLQVVRLACNPHASHGH